jgi:hypothetical protein
MARDYAALIAGLLAHAENEANPEVTRQAYRDKAESMMREYRIEESQAMATDPGSIVPTVKTIVLMTTYSTFKSSWYPQIFQILADHTECRAYVRWVGENLVAETAGFPGDVRYLEFLWTAAQLMFSTRIDPTWSADRTEAENIFLFRNAGIQRREIADKAWGYGAGNQAKNRSKVQRIYLAEAKRRGEIARATGLGFDMNTYRKAYAMEFFNTLYTRLWRARQAADAANGKLVLAGRDEAVKEALWTAFPKLRPSTHVAQPYVDPREGCVKCQKAASGYCREHNWLKPRETTQADRDRWERERNSTSARAGAASGRVAAEGVHIARGSETGKMDPSDTRAIG